MAILRREGAYRLERTRIYSRNKERMRKMVYCKRECLRCGIKEKRKFSENIDGTLAAAGWERIEEPEDHADHYKET